MGLINSIDTALQLANEQRNAYGLRYNDFTRYRYVYYIIFAVFE